MKSLVIGNGEVGKALHQIFSEAHECHIRDIEPLELNGVQVLHIAFPHTSQFFKEVSYYVGKYQPRLTMIHSSVPIGTTAKFKEAVVHSPERGRHPNLAFEMKQFVKFVGGFKEEDLDVAERYLAEVHWPSIRFFDPHITEALKLISNAHLGLEVAWRQEVQGILDRYCSKNETAYALWEDSYNQGYSRLGHKQMIRPRMSPDPIGGHCVLPCIEMLERHYKSKAFDWIKEKNAERQTAQILTAAGNPGSPEAA